MTIPKKLKIGGHIYKIRFANDLDDDAAIDNDKSEILIRKQLSKSQQESRLIHEIFHAMNSSTEDRHHGLIDSLAEQFYQVLKDNKLLK
jgi:Zn-dependent peptidase ImmA (M78 family)